MKQNYNSLLSTLSSSLLTIFPIRKSFLVNDVASLCQDTIKAKRGNLQLVFLLLVAVSFGHQSIAQNTSNPIFKSQKIIVNHLLISSVAEGRGGGGGHGNLDWVKQHPRDVDQVDLESRILKTNDHNIL